MSVFRPRARRWPALLAVALAGVIVGGLLGYGLRGGGATFADQAASARERAQRIAAELGVMTTEYPQGVDRRGNVVSRTEYDGAVRRASEALRALDEEAADLRALDPDAHARTRRQLGLLQQAVAGRRPPAEVLALVGRVRAALTALTG